MINEEGMRLHKVSWRRVEDHSVIAGFDGAALDNRLGGGEDLRMACLPMQDLDAIMLKWFVEKYGGTVSWNHRVVDVGQGNDTAWVEVETPGGKKRIEADYVVGCDGAGSQVRKSLFGDEFSGWTWDDVQIIATNVSRSPALFSRNLTLVRYTMILKACLAFTMPTSSSIRSTSL